VDGLVEERGVEVVVNVLVPETSCRAASADIRPVVVVIGYV